MKHIMSPYDFILKIISLHLSFIMQARNPVYPQCLGVVSKRHIRNAVSMESLCADKNSCFPSFSAAS